MKGEDQARLAHMIEAAELALRFIAGRRRADLDDDPMLLFALVRAIEIIGEAASRLSDETRSAYSEIPWKAIVGMRNRLIHGYFDVDTEVVWKTVTQEIPVLLPHLQTIHPRI